MILICRLLIHLKFSIVTFLFYIKKNFRGEFPYKNPEFQILWKKMEGSGKRPDFHPAEPAGVEKRS